MKPKSSKIWPGLPSGRLRTQLVERFVGCPAGPDAVDAAGVAQAAEDDRDVVRGDPPWQLAGVALVHRRGDGATAERFSRLLALDHPGDQPADHGARAEEGDLLFRLRGFSGGKRRRRGIVRGAVGSGLEGLV